MHFHMPGVQGYTISEVAKKIEDDYGKIDVLVHSLANGPEVKNPLLETSRNGYLAALSMSSYSYISLVQVSPLSEGEKKVVSYL